ncbi:MAG: hypothetical protein Q4D00_09180, partial [Clostridia bacterium]|nr:hypothetical protein [Clostridia bacterium]
MAKKMKRNSLIWLLVLTLCFGVIPFNLELFEANAATAKPTVKVKTYSKKAGRYTVKVKQAKVDYKTMNVYLPGIKTLKKVKDKKKKVYKVKATAYMYCDKKVSKQKSKTVKLSKISSSKKYFEISVPAMGKYDFVVKYYNKKGKRIKTVTVKNAGAIAQEYNIAVMNGTYGPLLFSLSLWDINKGSDGNPIPTTVSMARKGTYNWKKLPSNVQLNPKWKDPLSSDKMGPMTDYMRKYVSDLRSLNKESKFHFYFADNYVKGILELACKNKLPEDRYDVTFMSDGSASYYNFNNAYGGTNAQSVHDTMCAEWNIFKNSYKKGHYIDISDAKYYTGHVSSGLQRYTYAALSTSNNVKWIVGRKDGTFDSKDTAFITEAKSHIEQMN